MKTINTIIVCLLLSSGVNGQNLVTNGSFEQYSHCPHSIGELDSCIGWHSVKNTPDYYSTCADSFTNASVPTNYAGTQISFEGNGYIGLYTYYRCCFYREIAGASLINTLIPGNTYHVSMRVSKGNVTINNYGCGATSKLGMRFTTYPYSLVDTPSINNYAQIFEDSIITDTLNWILLAWDYIPDSAYTHVYIGNFFDQAHTDTISIANNQPSLYPSMNAYYYIDSVNIICTNCSSGIEPIQRHEILLQYDIDNNSVYINYNTGRFGKLSIINSVGQTIEKFDIINEQKVNLSNLKDGLYIALYQSEKVTLTKKIIVQK